MKEPFEDLFKYLYEYNIKEIKAIRDLSIRYNMLDEQIFLDWLDDINSLSIDPER